MQQSMWRRLGALALVGGLLVGCGASNQPSGASTAVVDPTVLAEVPPTEAPSAGSQPTAITTETTAVATAAPGAETPPIAANPCGVGSPGTVQAAAAATTVFDPTQVKLKLEPVADGLKVPVFVTHAGDGSGVQYVVEKAGTIRRLPGKELFLDITDRVGSDNSEQGLLGLAFHPRYAENGAFFVNYTDQDGHTVIGRFTRSADGCTGDPSSEQVYLHQEQPAANHNGGMLAFGPDGMLYIGLGDGGGANDRYKNGQNQQTLLGKLLRIDVDSGLPYSIPPSNPLTSDTSLKGEIWAYGLRNPWRFSFDRATKELYIADVGQGQYEEINVQPADSKGGENYGWPITEGKHCFQTRSCDSSQLVQPVAEYDHDAGCSVTGGYVYRGSQYPKLVGAYVFGDFCSGRIWTLARDAAGAWQLTEMLKTDYSISSFGEDEAGEIYLTDMAGGVVYRVTTE